MADKTNLIDGQIYLDKDDATAKMVMLPNGQILYVPATAAGGGFSPYWAAGSNVIMNNGSP